MKNILMILAATTMAISPLATTSANATPKHKIEKTVQTNHGKRAVVTKTAVAKSNYKQQHHWAKGQKFDSRYAANYRVINDPQNHRLYSAPRGHQWVQSGNDAVLVAITSGLIGAVIGNALR